MLESSEINLPQGDRILQLYVEKKENVNQQILYTMLEDCCILTEFIGSRNAAPKNSQFVLLFIRVVKKELKQKEISNYTKNLNPLRTGVLHCFHHQVGEEAASDLVC